MTFFDKSLLGMTSVVFTTLFGRSYLNYQVKLAELKSVISEKEALKLQIIETKQEIVALSSQIKAIPVSSRTPICNIGFNFHRGGTIWPIIPSRYYYPYEWIARVTRSSLN
jgi:hypothetical protein